MLSSLRHRHLHFAAISPLVKSAACFTLTTLLAMTAATAQIAAPNSAGLDTTGNPRSETAACNSGQTQQDRDACLQEVRNASAEKRAGDLGTGGNFTANAMRRCDTFTQPDALAACRARLSSEAQLDGSVGSGGVIRQTETAIPAVPVGPAVSK